MADYFTLTMPGQPPSWNHMYNERGVWEYDPIQRKQVYRRKKFKQPGVETYQQQLTMLVRNARPTDFRPADKVIVAYVLYVDHDIDVDNVMKACNDAIAKGLGINDRQFLPVPLDKSTDRRDPRLELAIFDAEKYRVVIDRR